MSQPETVSSLSSFSGLRVFILSYLFLFILLDCSQMEDQLSALGERWSHVCQWAEQRAVGLEQLANHWEQLETDLKKIKSWLATHEHSLRLIEANPSTDRNQMMDVARQLQVSARNFSVK